jgi:excinuclease ABC subunit A
MMTVVTGVSGSGKSTLVHEVIYKTLEARLLRQSGGERPNRSAYKAACRAWRRVELVRELVLVDQSPIGRTPRSNPGDLHQRRSIMIREICLPKRPRRQARLHGGHFSFNIAGGRCETCQGDGTVTVEMQFLADVELVCEDCRGTRYKPAILDVRYKGPEHPRGAATDHREAIVLRRTHTPAGAPAALADVGLGYLRLGQSATTLSGGEAQRVKLAAHLTQSSTKACCTCSTSRPPGCTSTTSPSCCSMRSSG